MEESEENKSVRNPTTKEALIALEILSQVSRLAEVNFKTQKERCNAEAVLRDYLTSPGTVRI